MLSLEHSAILLTCIMRWLVLIGFDWFKPSNIFFYRPFQGLLWMIYVISVLFLLCFRVRLFIHALWSTAGKGLASWLSFVMSYCEVVTFQLVSWFRFLCLIVSILDICTLSYFEIKFRSFWEWPFNIGFTVYSKVVNTRSINISWDVSLEF